MMRRLLLALAPLLLWSSLALGACTVGCYNGYQFPGNPSGSNAKICSTSSLGALCNHISWEFIVPGLTGTSGNGGYVWPGISGPTNINLIQAGIKIVLGGSPVCQGFYALYNGSSGTVPFGSVCSAGDYIFTTIDCVAAVACATRNSASEKWAIEVKDCADPACGTVNWDFTNGTPKCTDGTQASCFAFQVDQEDAEFIAETDGNMTFGSAAVMHTYNANINQAPFSVAQMSLVVTPVTAGGFTYNYSMSPAKGNGSGAGYDFDICPNGTSKGSCPGASIGGNVNGIGMLSPTPYAIQSNFS